METARSHEPLRITALNEGQQCVVAQEITLPVQFIGLGTQEGTHTFKPGDIFTIQSIGKLHQPCIVIKAYGHACPRVVRLEDLEQMVIENPANEP